MRTKGIEQAVPTGTVIVTTLLLLFLGLPVARGEEDQTADTNSLIPDPPLYVIQANDLLEIVVWGEPDISRTVLVRPDGRISLPLVQDLRAAEQTPVELKEQIENRLKEYVDSDLAP